MVSKVSYEAIWSTLSNVDVTPYVEKKMGLSYLSWAHAWRLLMDNYPSASYEFAAVEYYTDESAMVFCTVIIPGDLDCSRSMWLPVMDHKMKSIHNPSSRDISDNKMRCLVKCLAMFGLGHNLYTGEEFEATVRGEEAEVEKPKKAKPAEKEPEAKAEKPKPKGGNDIPTAEGAADVVEKLILFAKEFCSDEDALRDYWRKNKQLIDILDTNFNAQYQDLKAGFTELRKQLTNGEDNA